MKAFQVVAELLVDAALHRAFLRGERSLYSHLWVLESKSFSESFEMLSALKELLSKLMTQMHNYFAQTPDVRPNSMAHRIRQLRLRLLL